VLPRKPRHFRKSTPDRFSGISPSFLTFPRSQKHFFHKTSLM